MSDKYKQQIMERIKQSINNWIEELKTKHPELLLTNKVQDEVKVTSGNNGDRIDSVKNDLVRSTYLPEWFKTIESLDIRTQLLEKIAESLIHYENQLGRKVDLKEFFGKYTEHLQKQDKLYRFCKYKSKPVSFDKNNWCEENYCSKKPYNAVCPQGVLKFGNKPMEDF